MSDKPLHSLTDDELRSEVGKAMEPLWWIRQYLDDDSDQAKAFDEVRAYAQGLDSELDSGEPTP